MWYGIETHGLNLKFNNSFAHSLKFLPRYLLIIYWVCSDLSIISPSTQKSIIKKKSKQLGDYAIKFVSIEQ